MLRLLPAGWSELLSKAGFCSQAPAGRLVDWRTGLLRQLRIIARLRWRQHRPLLLPVLLQLLLPPPLPAPPQQEQACHQRQGGRGDRDRHSSYREVGGVALLSTSTAARGGIDWIRIEGGRPAHHVALPARLKGGASWRPGTQVIVARLDRHTLQQRQLLGPAGRYGAGQIVARKRAANKARRLRVGCVAVVDSPWLEPRRWAG